MNWNEEAIVCTCDNCGASIYAGERYLHYTPHFTEINLCMECVDDCTVTAEAEEDYDED